MAVCSASLAFMYRIRWLQGLALPTLSWDKNWDSHSLVNGYPSFYPRIALVAPSPGRSHIQTASNEPLWWVFCWRKEGEIMTNNREVSKNGMHKLTPTWRHSNDKHRRSHGHLYSSLPTIITVDQFTIACSWRRGMSCELWVQNFTYALFNLLSWRMKYLILSHKWTDSNLTDDMYATVAWIKIGGNRYQKKFI